jgi:energy-coupling factor transporter ATP-binding protein EcfA2
MVTLPKTDAEAIGDILAWSLQRPAWQRHALRLLAQGQQITQEQIDDLYATSFGSKPATAALGEADIRSSASETSELILKAISGPEDVNALATDQTLSFEKTGLTVIYGDNGAGKSGYARILKHACRARTDNKDLGVLANIYAQAPGTPRAKITYFANAQKKETNWQLNQASPPELSAVSVFDARTAHVHIDGTNDVAYVPASLDLIQRLAKLAEAIRKKAAHAKTEIEAQTPESLRNPPIDAGTTVAKAVRSLDPATDITALEISAALTDQEVQAIADLKRDLATDPAKLARQSANARDGLGRFEQTIKSLCSCSDAATLADLKTLYETRNATREAAKLAAENRFATEPLPQAGSETWRALWEAARHYATRDAKPGQPFPPQQTLDHCPLCQQPLSEEALDRFARFEAFVRDDTKRRADNAEQAYANKLTLLRKGQVPASQLGRSLRYIHDNLDDQPAYLAARKTAVSAAWQLRRMLREHSEPDFRVEDINQTEALAELHRLKDKLLKRETALTANATSPERKALVAQCHELEARQWLATVLPDVKNEIERKKQLAQIDRVLSETETRAITQKATQLAEALVTDALRAQFTKEIASLGVAHLAVELKKESSQAGAARFRVRLIRKPTAPVGSVLSEGEHRCVALAAFLAELATSGSKSAIIFDDPVSSLDHQHRAEVANRLAAEARVRQVIVFTHDVAFLMLLSQAAADAEIHVGYRCVARGSELAGYCSHDLPYNARPVESVMAAIEGDVKNKSIQWSTGKQAEWRNTARATLEQLRETWERAVEEFIGPVFKRLSTKVDTKNLRKLTVLEIADCDAMREGFQACSELLHSVGESLNPKLPSPEDLQREIEKLKLWYADIRKRQDRIKAA